MIDRIELLFRISMYLLLALSSVAIGLAEGNLFPHLLTLPLIALVYFYLDAHPVLKTESLGTNILGLAALLIAFLEFRQGSVNVEMRILSASHLLAYFTWIVLLVKKQNQQYWWLLALSVLNMSIAASLTNSFLFGLAILSYLFLGIAALTLFTTYRGTSSLRKSPRQTTATLPADSLQKPAAVSTVSQPVGPIASKVRGGFHIDPSERWLGIRFLGVVSFISIASMLVGVGLFLITPRVIMGNWKFPSGADERTEALPYGKAVSGFTSEVKLGDIGEILQSSTPVMRVQFFENETDKILHAEEVADRLKLPNLLFRGSALGIYKRGSWSAGERFLGYAMQTASNSVSRNAIRQTYELEPVGCDTLFVCFPVELGRLQNQNFSSSRIPQNSLTGKFSFSGQTQFLTRTIRYETISVPAEHSDPSGFPVIKQRDDRVYITDTRFIRRHDKLGFQKVLNTISDSVESEYQKGQEGSELRTDFSRFTYQSPLSPSRVLTYDVYLRSLLEIDRSQLPRLVTVAKELCSKKEDNLSPVERVRVLRDYLRNSGNFSYTLDLSITDPSIDPVEDFLFNRKAGHCEYFASALTLMLRATGVPARLVTGFSAGRWDEKTERLLVEQRHAHAWTEAFVDGRWLVIDATPPSNAMPQSFFSMSAFSWEAIQGKLSSLWQSYVQGISLAWQEENIYAPLRKQSKSVYQQAKDLSNTPLMQDLMGKKNSGGLRFFLSILIIFLPIIMPVLLFILFLYRGRIIHLLHKWMPGRSSIRHQKKMLFFFRQFLDLSARNGLRKQPEQTAREFAHIFQQRFGMQLASVSLEYLPDALTNAYYQARFRGNELSEQDLRSWKSQIDKLAQVMKSQR